MTMENFPQPVIDYVNDRQRNLGKPPLDPARDAAAFLAEVETLGQALPGGSMPSAEADPMALINGVRSDYGLLPLGADGVVDDGATIDERIQRALASGDIAASIALKREKANSSATAAAPDVYAQERVTQIRQEYDARIEVALSEGKAVEAIGLQQAKARDIEAELTSSAQAAYVADREHGVRDLINRINTPDCVEVPWSDERKAEYKRQQDARARQQRDADERRQALGS
jgi:hypothetical protein